MIVDSHCHLDQLDLTPYDGDVGGAIAAAREAGIEYLLSVCINLELFPKIVSIAEQYDNISITVGIHPNEVLTNEPTLEELTNLAKHPAVVGIGETGLDYFRTTGDVTWQQERFVRHITLGKQKDLPLIIHSRDAWDDTFGILKDESASNGVFHCFTGNWEQAKTVLDMGFMISFSGIVTFNSAKDLQEVAAKIPADRMLVETDSPYLAPVPFRGKPNEPAYTRYVAEQVANLRGVAVEEVAEQTTENFFNLFSKIDREKS